MASEQLLDNCYDLTADIPESTNLSQDCQEGILSQEGAFAYK